MEREQNFLNQVSVEKLQATPPGFYKSIFLDLLSISAAFIFGYLYYLFLKDGIPIYWVLVSLAVFGALLLLRVFLIKGFLRTLLVTLFQVAAILGIFYFYYQSNLSFLITSGIIMFVLFVLGNLISKQELEDVMRIRFFKIGKKLVSKFITAVILGALILYLPQWQAKDIFLSEKSFENFFSLVSSFLQKLYPEINFNSTVSGFTESWAKFELEKNKAFNTFPQAERQKAIQALSSQILNNLGSNKDINKNQLLSSFFYQQILNSLTEWHKHYQKWFLMVWTISMFLILRFFGSLFGWVVLFTSFFIYQILLNFGITNIIFENQSKETVEFT